MSKELQANTNLSHYRIVEKIGAGGMGEVYLGYEIGETADTNYIVTEFIEAHFSAASFNFHSDTVSFCSKSTRAFRNY